MKEKYPNNDPNLKNHMYDASDVIGKITFEYLLGTKAGGSKVAPLFSPTRTTEVIISAATNTIAAVFANADPSHKFDDLILSETVSMFQEYLQRTLATYRRHSENPEQFDILVSQ